jgi:hypothetical protein
MFYYGCESNDQLQPITPNPPVNDTDSKKVLLEFFTNAGCNPCIAAHHYLDGITALSGVTINDTNVIIISWHTRYPYIFDSLYQANIPHNQGRSDYYGINFTPQGRLDGVTTGQFSASAWTGLLNAELQTTNFIDIDLTNTYNSGNNSGNVSAEVTLLNSIPTTDNVIHFIITESNVPYPTAPNGITNPDDVMRTMITGLNGQAITVGQGTTTVDKTYSLNSNWNRDECYLTVFIQSTSTKQIFGVERVKVTQ